MSRNSCFHCRSDFNGSNNQNIKFGYHEPCHLISSGRKGATVKLLSDIPIESESLKTECCGIVGSWGFKAKNYKYSQKFAKERFYPELTREDVDVLITDCPTCKMQMLNVDKEIKHPTQVLRDAYGLDVPKN